MKPSEKQLWNYGTVDDDVEEYEAQIDSLKESSHGVPRPSVLVIPFFLFIVASYFLLGLFTAVPDSFLTVEQRANRILTQNPLIGNHIYGNDFKKKFEKGGFTAQVDIPRLAQGKNGGAFWSAYVPCPAQAWNFSDETYEPFVRATLEQIDLFHRLSKEYPKQFTPTPDHLSALAAFSSGRLISPLAIEGLHQIGNSLSTLRLYHRLGVRYATLTWNCHNKYADAAIVPDPDSGRNTAKKPLHHGLSSAGRTLIHEMNRMGMFVDLSHVSAETMRDVLTGAPSPDPDDPSKFWNASIAPPIFSHSSAYSVCPHPRNVPDDVLQLVKERRSLVMVNFNPGFISCVPGPETPETGIPVLDSGNATLKQVVKHIRYIGELIGYDYVGIGSDFDGIQDVPKGLEDVSKFPDLVAELLRQGVSDADAAKVVGRNLLRVWEEVDRVAEELQKSVKPVEDDLPSMRGIYDIGREL
ncbi:MAG: hypothetical protein M1820_006520 [Bogoriella megaspora]|nr:MAG: hypothetical protein M1820_006520 [Bogoriella megaspora]